MESREGLLISIIDTATLGTGALDQIDRLVIELLAGGDMKLICSQILSTTLNAREALVFEQRLAEEQRQRHA